MSFGYPGKSLAKLAQQFTAEPPLRVLRIEATARGGQPRRRQLSAVRLTGLLGAAIVNRLRRPHEWAVVVSSGYKIHDLLDRMLQFILVAPILVDCSVFLVVRTVEAIFDVVVPDDHFSNDGYNPEAPS